MLIPTTHAPGSTKTAVNHQPAANQLIAEKTPVAKASFVRAVAPESCSIKLVSKDAGPITDKLRLSERALYPVNAVKKRLVNFAVLGSVVGLVLCLSLPALVGALVGGTIGGAIKLANMIMGENSRALDVGLVVGGMTGAALGAVAAMPLMLLTVAAFSVLGLAKSAALMPFDIYRAITLNDRELEAYFNESIVGLEGAIAEPVLEQYREIREAMATGQIADTLKQRYGAVTIDSCDYAELLGKPPVLPVPTLPSSMLSLEDSA